MPHVATGRSGYSRVQRAELLGRLAGGMAHDLNNCLATIRIYADLALADLSEDAPNREDLAEIHRAAEHAGAMIHRLLSFGREPQGRRLVVDLGRSLQRVTRLLEHALREHVELRVEAPAGETTVLVDPAGLDQLILNLALNADDAMPDGGILTLSTRRVDLAPEEAGRLGLEPGSHSVLRVSDNGCGMKPETVPKIFIASFTTKEDHGMGLGLALVAEFVRESEGAISVESEPERGTSFEVFFPTATGVPCDPSGERSPTPPRGTETILLVEADDVLRSVAGRLLEVQGYTVLCARSASDGREQAMVAGDAIDLILTAGEAPGDLARELSARPVQEDRPIKFLRVPGDPDATALPEVLDGSLDSLEKPFGGDDLLAAVRRVLDD